MALGYEDGEIYIFDINKQGLEKNARLTTQLKNKSKVKIIAYISNLIILSLDYSFGHNKEAS